MSSPRDESSDFIRAEQLRDAAAALAAMPPDRASSIDVIEVVEHDERDRIVALAERLAARYGLRVEVRSKEALTISFERDDRR